MIRVLTRIMEDEITTEHSKSAHCTHFCGLTPADIRIADVNVQLSIIYERTIAMERGFSGRLHALRAAKGLSQRAVAADLHISQALLSHYENGAREPGLQFVCRACDYYGVSADYLLGRTDQPTLPTEQIERLRLAVRAMQSTAEQAAHALSSLTGDIEP